MIHELALRGAPGAALPTSANPELIYSVELAPIGYFLYEFTPAARLAFLLATVMSEYDVYVKVNVNDPTAGGVPTITDHHFMIPASGSNQRIDLSLGGNVLVKYVGISSDPENQVGSYLIGWS